MPPTHDSKTCSNNGSGTAKNLQESLRKKAKTSRGKNRFMDTFKPSLIPFIPLHSTFSLADISRIS